MIIGWTDENGTHLDILFNYRAYKQTGNYLQRGLNGQELFVSIMSWGAFGFDTSNYDKSSGYIADKLNIRADVTADKLAELINGVIRELEEN